jgi:hypothetical protein
MHFTYESILSKTELMQGDVLSRTSGINSLLERIHPHFHSHTKNLFFMVLTQSCDLVPRGNDGKCKAPYITIAPIRSLDLVIEKYLAQLGSVSINAELPVISAKSKDKAAEFLHRLFNNNESGYFYLDADDTSLPCECVAFLNLSIAIKSDFHYKECLNAKVLQLTDTFQAKLGWLVGQMYSRVGTKDWESGALKNKVKKALNSDIAIWVENDKVKLLEDVYEDLSNIEPNVIMSRADISKAIKNLPTRKQKVLEQAEKILTEVLGQDDPMAAKLRKRLENDTALTSLLK